MYVYMHIFDQYNRKSLHSYFVSNLCHIRLRLPKLSVTGKAAVNPDLRLPKIAKQNKTKLVIFQGKTCPGCRRRQASRLIGGAALPRTSALFPSCRTL